MMGAGANWAIAQENFNSHAGVPHYYLPTQLQVADFAPENVENSAKVSRYQILREEFFPV